MPAKKTETDEKKKVAKKPATPKKKTISANKTTTPTTAKSSSKKTTLKKSKSVVAATAPKKENTVVSKKKQKKIRIEDKFSDQRYHLGVGKRKSAIALVRLHEKGKGEVYVNNVTMDEYFFGTLVQNALQPLKLTGQEKSYSITAKLIGGGVSSQAEALRHGIARALVLSQSDFRPLLKKAGFLTRDARVKERKKPGLKRARRAPQWKKR